MSKRAATVTWIAGVCVTAGLVGGCAPGATSPTSSTTGPVAAASASGAEPAGEIPASPVAATTAADTVRVTSVIDGDTIVVTGGRRVRVLGIDSCEAATPGGRRATAAARTRLDGAAVRLTAEPGVDLDRYGRELRYVATDAGDFGEYMVAADHTAVYQGHNDASPARLATLRALDGNGRVCGAPEAAGSSNPAARPTPKPRPAPKPAPKPAPRLVAPAAPAPAPAPAPAAYYKNCDAARAAGVAPLHVGQPGYSGKLDRDGDGVACE